MTPAAVISRIEEAEIFPKLIDYAMQHAGASLCLIGPEAATYWVLQQAKPILKKLWGRALRQMVMEATLNEFRATLAHQLEIVGPHLAQLAAIQAKHADPWAIGPSNDQGGQGS